MFQVEENECDTQVILDILAGCSDEKSVLSTLGKIQGPWSFQYWQVSNTTHKCIVSYKRDLGSSVDPDEMMQNAESDQSLFCFK